MHENAALFIDGQWRQGGGARFSAIAPASGAVIWDKPAANADDVVAAVAAARGAFEGWADQDFEARAALIKNFATVLEANRDSLAAAIALDTGKPRWEAVAEVNAMIGKVAISIRAYQDRTGTRSEVVGAGRAVVRHRPHGVMAVFGPYNFPGHLPNGHIVPALLAGNCVVFKPSELTPLVAEQTVRLWQQAGLPAGVLNLLQGGRDTGKALAEAALDGLLFTGSAATGRVLARQFADRPATILALELGGNNPLVVWDSHDVPAAARIILQSAYQSAGQRCTCARRLILPNDDRADKVLAALIALLDRVTIGGDDSFMGPVISNVAADALLAAQAALIDKGGVALRQMMRLSPGLPLLSPGLIDVTAITARGDEEYFGPMLQIVRVDHFAAALREANATRFGLAAGLISDDATLWDLFQRRCRAGVVNWNRPLTGASSAAPFGGIGASGNHRASAYYAADYCAYPVASLEIDLPETAAIQGLRP